MTRRTIATWALAGAALGVGGVALILQGFVVWRLQRALWTAEGHVTRIARLLRTQMCTEPYRNGSTERMLCEAEDSCRHRGHDWAPTTADRGGDICQRCGAWR